MLEAMGMGKAIVATPVDGTKEAIQHEQNGLLVPCHDYQALAREILRLHQNPELRKKLGDAARKTVENTFDVKAMVQNNEQIYKSLIPAAAAAA